MTAPMPALGDTVTIPAIGDDAPSELSWPHFSGELDLSEFNPPGDDSPTRAFYLDAMRWLNETVTAIRSHAEAVRLGLESDEEHRIKTEAADVALNRSSVERRLNRDDPAELERLLAALRRWKASGR